MNRTDFRALRKRIGDEKPESVPFLGFTEKQLQELFRMGFTKFVEHPFKGVYLLKGAKPVGKED